MAEFHEIGSSQFTDVIPTGEEKIQISASQRTTLQNIANLATEKGVKQVVVTNFQTNTWKLRDGESVSFSMDIKDGEIVTFTSARDAVNGPGVELFGYAIKHHSLIASYVGMTTSNKVNGIPTIYTYKSAWAYATAWMTINSGASSGGIAVGATLWAGEVSLKDDVPDVFDLPSGLQNGDILTIMYDLNVGTNPDSFFVTGVNRGRTFNVVVGEHLTRVQYSAFYNAGGSQGGVISENGTMDIDCTVSQLTVIVKGGVGYPVGYRITVKRIYKSADNNPAYN